MTGEARPGSRRSILWAGAATLVAFAILVGLGMWQLERKAWKEGLINAIASRAHGEPTTPTVEADWPLWRAQDDEFRRVRLKGEFLHEGEVLVHGLAELKPRQASQGFYVFTPLLRPNGSVVIVNRGFVPTELREAGTRRPGQIAGHVWVTGLVRAPETRGAFVPANDPGRNEWFVRSLADMVAARGLERVAPFYVDADDAANPGGWPRGGQTRIVLPNDHLQYALTWFGLAGALLAVVGAFTAARLRERGSAEQLQSEDADHDQPDTGEPTDARRLSH